jgi:hypothetical protein
MSFSKFASRGDACGQIILLPIRDHAQSVIRHRMARLPLHDGPVVRLRFRQIPLLKGRVSLVQQLGDFPLPARVRRVGGNLVLRGHPLGAEFLERLRLLLEQPQRRRATRQRAGQQCEKRPTKRGFVHRSTILVDQLEADGRRANRNRQRLRGRNGRETRRELRQTGFRKGPGYRRPVKIVSR